MTRVISAGYEDVKQLRKLNRSEANCQMIYDSFLPRCITDAYLLELDGRTAGYGAVSNKYDAGRLIEFYIFPQHRALALPLFRELLSASNAYRRANQHAAPISPPARLRRQCFS